MNEEQKRRLAIYGEMATMNKEQVEDYFLLRGLAEKEAVQPAIEPIEPVLPVEKPVTKKKKK